MAKKKGCYLYSKANYSICLDYDGEHIVVPPYANGYKVADESKLGTIPSKIKKVSIEPEVATNDETSANDEGGK